MRGHLRAAIPAYVKAYSSGEYVFDRSWADACHRTGIRYYLKLRRPYRISATASQSRCRCQQSTKTIWRNRGYRDFQDFLDTLSSRKRKQLRKEHEQVSQPSIEFEWCTDRQLCEQEWDFVYSCYANTYLIRKCYSYLNHELFSLLDKRMPEAIRIVFVRQGSKPVAMAFSLIAGDTLYGRYWGCLDSFNQLHLETCFYQGLDFAIAAGLTYFDAGAQGEHKPIRGFEPVLTHSGTIWCIRGCVKL